MDLYQEDDLRKVGNKIEVSNAAYLPSVHYIT